MTSLKNLLRHHLRLPTLWLALRVAPLAAAGPGSIFNVTAFGAKGDGTTLDTAALQRAIDACAEAGGGTVYFPHGVFLTGSLRLRSNLTVELSAGAVLSGSTRLDDYPQPHLLYAVDAENITLTGTGTINGNGDGFLGRDKKPYYQVGQMIDFIRCRRLRIEGITLLRSPAWTLHPQGCDDVRIRGITIKNNLKVFNTDGIDIDSSRNVIVSDCYIESGDDCIVLKTTGFAGVEATPTENVLVNNCVVVSGSTALKLGTESWSDFRHCVFSNCIVRNSHAAIALLAKDGGTMEDIVFSNLDIATTPRSANDHEWVVTIDLDKRSAQSKPSHIRNVSLRGITIGTRGRILVEGTPQAPIEGVVLRDIVMNVAGYENIKGVHKLVGAKASDLGAGRAGPDFGAVPAALIFGYIRGLTVDQFTLRWPAGQTPPPRHAIYGEGVKGYRLSGLDAASSSPDLPPIRMEHSEN